MGGYGTIVQVLVGIREMVRIQRIAEVVLLLTGIEPVFSD